MSQELIVYNAACRAIAEAHRIDEVKEWHNKAAAMQEYARQAKNLELEKQAFEIRKRAEWRMGELLIETKRTRERSVGGKSAKVTNTDMVLVPTLADIGLTANQSSRYQKLAAIPRHEFEQIIKDGPLRPHKATPSGTRFTDLKLNSTAAQSYAQNLSDKIKTLTLSQEDLEVLFEYALAAHKAWLNVAEQLKKRLPKDSHLSVVGEN